MATYNGAKYIEDQINSIQAQTITDWSLLIRDDGSRDDTFGKIIDFSQKDNRIILLQDGLGNLGISQNFACLMQVALNEEADYVAMSDQDDVWHPEKLQYLLGEIKRIESDNITCFPVLVHSDLEVVNEAMRTINPSFMDYAGISPSQPRLEYLLCQNIVTGCTCLINRTLLKLALPIPHEVPIHDWWLALLALSYGKIGYIEQPLVRYRQHAQNIVGVKYDLARTVRYLLKPGNWRQQINAVRSSILQAGLLIERLQLSGVPLGNINRLDVVDIYSRLANMARYKRLKFLAGHNINKRSMFSNLVYKVIVLCLPSSMMCRNKRCN